LFLAALGNETPVNKSVKQVELVGHQGNFHGGSSFQTGPLGTIARIGNKSSTVYIGGNF